MKYAALLLLPLLFACEERYRYPCQNPYNWNEEQCKKPYCSANGTCPEDLRHYVKDSSEIQQSTVPYGFNYWEPGWKLVNGKVVKPPKDIFVCNSCEFEGTEVILKEHVKSHKVAVAPAIDPHPDKGELVKEEAKEVRLKRHQILNV